MLASLYSDTSQAALAQPVRLSLIYMATSLVALDW